MRVRAAAPAWLVAFCLLATILTGGVPSARAQAGVDGAEREAGEAERAVDQARRLVDETVADRDKLEAELLTTLDEYQAAAEELVEAGRNLDRVGAQLARTEATAVELEVNLEQQLVLAYIEAIASPGTLVWSSDSVEDALLVGSTLETTSADTSSSIGLLAVSRSQLKELQQEFSAEREHVAALQAELEADAERLQALFERADAAVAAAFEAARVAEASYRAALDDVALARAKEADRRLQEEESRRRATATTTTTAGPASGGGATTTTTTPATTSTTRPQPPPSTGPGTYRAAVERWRSIVSAHFPASRVEEALQVMQCESGGDPEARNPYTGASGLYQFMPGTWAVTSVKAGVGDRSVFDGEANIIAAAWLGAYYESVGQDWWRPWHCKPWSY
ncbi:MAG: transglycosylase SLT domain-containing protein [Acidimicrobiia bacterium]|jgi:soluble lytic murein transglycosylase-like protein